MSEEESIKPIKRKRNNPTELEKLIETPWSAIGDNHGGRRLGKKELSDDKDNSVYGASFSVEKKHTVTGFPMATDTCFFFPFFECFNLVFILSHTCFHVGSLVNLFCIKCFAILTGQSVTAFAAFVQVPPSFSICFCSAVSLSLSSSISRRTQGSLPIFLWFKMARQAGLSSLPSQASRKEAL